MVEPFALVLLLKVARVIHKYALQVKSHFKSNEQIRPDKN
jgi:hypothetical protein